MMPPDTKTPRLLAAAAILFCATLPRAADAPAAPLPPLERQALDRHLTDLTNCLAYYSIAHAALDKAGERATAAKVTEIRSILLDRSFIVMRAVEMNEETALARQKAAVQDQMTLIGDDFSRFPTLTEKYGVFCKEIVEDPGDRLQQWKDRLDGGARE